MDPKPIRRDSKVGKKTYYLFHMVDSTFYGGGI